jgi:hypothetical protein
MRPMFNTYRDSLVPPVVRVDRLRRMACDQYSIRTGTPWYLRLTAQLGYAVNLRRSVRSVYSTPPPLSRSVRSRRITRSPHLALPLRTSSSPRPLPPQAAAAAMGASSGGGSADSNPLFGEEPSTFTVAGSTCTSRCRTVATRDANEQTSKGSL